MHKKSSSRNFGAVRERSDVHGVSVTYAVRIVSGLSLIGMSPAFSV